MGKLTEPQIDISLCITTRGKEWLLKRTVEVLAQQRVSPDIEWEVVVIDDCSDVPIAPYLEPLKEAGVPVRSFRLDHTDGWRGITVGMMYAFEQARGRIIAETNSHLLLPQNAVNLLYFAHTAQDVRRVYCRTTEEQEDYLRDFPDRLWVSLRPFNLTTEATMEMDRVGWRDDITELWELPQTEDPWTRLWTDKFVREAGPNAKQLFGTHLICSIQKNVFDAVNPWPAAGFKDYGTDDPAYAGARRRMQIMDVNVWTPEDAVAHMAHNDHMQDAMELVPTRLNRKGHTRETAAMWDSPQEAQDKPKFQDVIDYWESGQRTTDWRVRDAWGWPNLPPHHYIGIARQYLKEGKVYLEEML